MYLQLHFRFRWISFFSILLTANVAVRSWRVNGNNDHEPMKAIDTAEFQSARKTSQSP
jgi:hypothetical protein